mmetsp:Transcript_22715/g.47651  ORF Transcript_22715/g.47651 Transcript_22715/m.47651 type:complete len:507 (-) Transcript_22715:158-1678(-)
MSKTPRPHHLHASFLRGSINVDELGFDIDDINLDDPDLPIDSDAGNNNLQGNDRIGFSFHRRSSVSDFNLNGLRNEHIYESPDHLAASAAKGVKGRFLDDLPFELLQDYGKKDVLARFAPKEIVLGRKLGSGEYSHVYSIRCFSLNSKNEETLSQDEKNERKHMKKNERSDAGRGRYALKHLRPELLTKYDPLDYAQAASDLALEAELLSSLQHPHIIKLRGISIDGTSGFAQGAKGYFLIIDKLTETLDARIKRWKKSKKFVISSVKKKAGKSDGKEEDVFSEDQVKVALQIAAAMIFLHSKKVIFRDLKPQNVGFDIRGDVKIFDFGLACLMPSNGDPNQDKYEMSGAGSPRYMAPEVLVDEPLYNLKADVYTFGIVLWEILSLQLPYSDITSRPALINSVVNKGERPPIPKAWPLPIRETMSIGFDAETEKRPTMELFYNILRFQLLELRGWDSSQLGNSFINRRRSTRTLCENKEGKTQSHLRSSIKRKMVNGMKKRLSWDM